MIFHSVVMNVADLERSIEFYREVFGFTVLASRDQVVAISAPDSDRPQVIVLRALGTSGRIGGARHVGMRALIVEVDSVEELDQIEAELQSRGSYRGRRRGPTWTAVVGTDPDHIGVVTACSVGSGRVSRDDWTSLDEFVYGIGE